MNISLSKPLVSIIVPVYKAEKTIFRCVNSLVNQTYPNIEIILVENGSPDNSGEVCDSFCDSRIRVLHTSNNGVSKARNDGLRIANGEYIAFCDSDDYYDKNHIKESLDAALAHNADIVISGYYVEVNDSFTKVQFKNSGFWTKDDIIKDIVTNNHIMGSCWNKLFKKSAIKDCIFPIDMTVLEDTYFFFRTFKNTNKIYYINKCLYYYCANPNSTVRNIKTLFSDDQFLYVNAYNKILHDFELTSKNQDLIRAALFLFAVKGSFLLKRRKISALKISNNLNKVIEKNKALFFKSKYFSFKQTIKVFFEYIFLKFWN